jgi:hypothetical protein
MVWGGAVGAPGAEEHDIEQTAALERGRLLRSFVVT